MEPITGLAYGRVTIGALSLLAPRLTSRLFLLDPQANPQLGYMGRLFGSRELALGLITLAAPAKSRERLVQLGAAVDGADAFTGLASVASRSVSTKAGLLLTAVALAAVVTEVRELQQR